MIPYRNRRTLPNAWGIGFALGGCAVCGTSVLLWLFGNAAAKPARALLVGGAVLGAAAAVFGAWLLWFGFGWTLVIDGRVARLVVHDRFGRERKREQLTLADVARSEWVEPSEYGDGGLRLSTADGRALLLPRELLDDATARRLLQRLRLPLPAAAP